MASLPPSSSAEEQLSFDFDNGRIDALRDPCPDNAAALTKSWQQLSDCLRQLPVTAVENLAAQVRVRIEADAQPMIQHDSEVKRARHDVTGLRRPIALLAASCAVLLMAINVSLQHFNRPVVAVASFTVLDPNAWEVVVVTVPDQQASLVTEQVRESVEQQGFRIHSLTSGTADDVESLELVMASAETSEQFLKVLGTDSPALETEWNPERIGRFDRDELLRKFAESMHTPTESDRYFGETFVILPDGDSVQVTSVSTNDESIATVAVSDNPANVGNHLASGVETESPSVVTQPAAPSTNEERLMEQLQKNVSRPVLVVFRKRPKLQSDSGSATFLNRA
ncbi:MAG: hypothetical protein R3C59_00580 [Planctomycetaceae bacterium]